MRWPGGSTRKCRNGNSVREKFSHPIPLTVCLCCRESLKKRHKKRKKNTSTPCPSPNGSYYIGVKGTELKGTKMENILSNVAKSAVVLPRQVQIDLVEAYQASKDSSALDKLVKSNLRLACKFANDYKRTGVEFEDLLAEAVKGILKAADMYEVGNAASFSTYAAQWMRAYVQDYVQENASTIRVGTRTGRKLYASLQRVRRKFGPDVDAKTIASELDLDENEVAETLQFLGRKAQSLDASINESGGTVATLVADPSLVQDELYEKFERIQMVRDAINSFSKGLNERDASIFTQRSVAEDGEKVGLLELGQQFGISKERVRQLENRILSNFKTYLLSRVQPTKVAALG